MGKPLLGSAAGEHLSGEGRRLEHFPALARQAWMWNVLRLQPMWS